MGRSSLTRDSSRNWKEKEEDDRDVSRTSKSVRVTTKDTPPESLEVEDETSPSALVTVTKDGEPW